MRDLEDAMKRKAELEYVEDILLQKVTTPAGGFNTSDKEKQRQEGEGKPWEAEEAEEDEHIETEGAKAKEVMEQVATLQREEAGEVNTIDKGEAMLEQETIQKPQAIPLA